MKIGADLISIKRFKKVKKTEYKKWSKVFSAGEWEHAFRKESARSLAGIFAAKEAGMKALGRAGAERFRDWEIKWKKNSAPKLLFKKKSKNIVLSIAHDGGFALAVVLII